MELVDDLVLEKFPRVCGNCANVDCVCANGDAYKCEWKRKCGFFHRDEPACDAFHYKDTILAFENGARAMLAIMDEIEEREA